MKNNLTPNQFKLLLLVQEEEMIDWDEVSETDFNISVYMELLDLKYIISLPVAWPFDSWGDGYYTLTEKGKEYLKMDAKLKEIFDLILEGNTQEYVNGEVDDGMVEYLDEHWEDDFDSIEEAYAETGRGASEYDILIVLINSFGGKNLSSEDHCILFDKLADHYSLNTN